MKRNKILRSRFKLQDSHTDTCDICNAEIVKGFGNNPYPLPHDKVCDDCNSKYVIPARLKNIMNQNKIQDGADLQYTVKLKDVGNIFDSVKLEKGFTVVFSRNRNNENSSYSMIVEMLSDTEDSFSKKDIELQEKYEDDYVRYEVEFRNYLLEVAKGWLSGYIENHVYEDTDVFVRTYLS